MFEQLQWKFEQLSYKFEHFKFEQVSREVEPAELEELINKIQEVCDKLDDLSSSPSSAPDQPAVAILVEASQGLAGMIMHAALSSETPVVKEQDLVELFAEPLQSDKVALAYNLVRQAIEEGPEDSKDNAKLLHRMVRDLLVLLVCVGESTGPWDNARLQAAMNKAFGKLVDDQAMSQLVLTFNKIVEYGKDREKFNTNITNKAYGAPVMANLADQIFAAFSECARMSPQYTSKSKKSGKFRPGKRSDRDRAASPAAATSPAQQCGEVDAVGELLQYNLSTAWQWPTDVPWYQLGPPPGLHPPGLHPLA